MIMFKKMKEFFATKYRITPVYQDNTKCGFTVHRKKFLGYWEIAKVPMYEKVKCDNELLVEHDAFFKTEEEAKSFIECQKTTV